MLQASLAWNKPKHKEGRKLPLQKLAASQLNAPLGKLHLGDHESPITGQKGLE